ncbi:hypothetical protein [Metasolibacillus meyeri]|uniref:hypothetical protein n=1 Tax=Metasolibacillus meyeri TaxID=1071052 RepID=UPI00187D5511|nr:hypothetical protein [Metasolibacillus meyeri]
MEVSANKADTSIFYVGWANWIDGWAISDAGWANLAVSRANLPLRWANHYF